MLLWACKKENVSPLVQIPEHFPQLPSTPDNPLTAQGITLGRLLFYDKRLSGNNQLSCASCHRQELAFTDGVALSNISGKQLHRSAPALINLAWMNNGLFWDGGATNLESQAFGPLTSEDEMHQNLAELEVELKAVPTYVQLFRSVFNDEIRSVYVVKALAQFQRTLISGASDYDKGILNTQQQKGLLLFNKHCSDCHSGPLFTDNSYHNNGIDTVFSDAFEGIYQGRFRVSYDPADIGKFKTPTLRNVALTAPYMHDGRFKDLETVLKHYGKDKLNDEEQKDIISFLHTLTDYSFINNKNFSE